MSLSLHHRLVVTDAKSHLVDVETTVRGDGPLPDGLTLFMPVWTPGSYLVREYARHVESLTCEAHGEPAPARKVRKNAWRIDAGGADVAVVRYRLYCNELSVRTNHVDGTHAFLNGAATFLAVEGDESATATVEVVAPEGWRVATTLPQAESGRPGFAFVARGLDELADSPLEIGTHREESFDVLGAKHTYAVWPHDAVEPGLLRRLVADTKAILETEAEFFGGTLPYDQYLFFLHVSGKGRGGLEHENSSVLLINPSSFSSRDHYLDLLSLVAHEAFHLWNVKRIKPAGLTPYRYEAENYTRQLWWFEGGTSYYDFRTLRLAKLCSVTEYLDHLASEIAYLDGTHGRFVHSLEEASFDAWIKLYRPDENSANSSVSYYRKGEVVCALLDLEIRGRSDGRASLDTVLRAMWDAHGTRGIPVPEGGLCELFERVTEVPLADLFDAWVRSPGEIDYAPTLARAGLSLERHPRADSPGCSLGMRVRSEGGRTIVGAVMRGASAQRAGIDPGDELVAVGGRRIEGTAVDAALHGHRPGERVEVITARDGRIHTRIAVLDEPRWDRVKIVPRADATAAQRALFAAWMGESA
jgi:predicted metalloprotease with PDZ domain